MELNLGDLPSDALIGSESYLEGFTQKEFSLGFAREVTPHVAFGVHDIRPHRLDRMASTTRATRSEPDPLPAPSSVLLFIGGLVGLGLIELGSKGCTAGQPPSPRAQVTNG